MAKVGDLKITCDGQSVAAPGDFRWLPEEMRTVVMSAKCVSCARTITVDLCAGTLTWAFRPWVLIVNVRHAKKPGFWERTSDQFIVGFVMAVAGVVLNRFR